MTEDLEQLLRQLPLRTPSAALDRRVEAALASPPVGGRLMWSRRLAPSGFAVAAAVVLLAALVAWRAFHHEGVPSRHEIADRGYTPATAPQALAGELAFEQIGIERVDRRVIDRGVVVANASVPFRCYRQQMLRQVWWFDAQTQTQMTATIPVERDVFIQQAVY